MLDVLSLKARLVCNVLSYVFDTKSIISFTSTFTYILSRTVYNGVTESTGSY